jgi:hypothetical protein
MALIESLSLRQVLVPLFLRLKLIPAAAAVLFQR